MKLTVTSINFSNLLALSSTISNLQPETKLENLDSYLIYSKVYHKLYLVVKGIYALARLEIPATLSSSDSSLDSTLGLMVNSSNIVHLLDNYTPEMREKIVLSIEITPDGKSKYSFTGNNDKINFSHMVLTESELHEIEELIQSFDKPKASYTFYLSYDQESILDILTGFSRCLSFIDDDIKNNAIAIYPTRFLTSDSRHIILYNTSSHIDIIDNSSINIHKKIIKTIIDVFARMQKSTVHVIDDKVYISSDTFDVILNNGIASISPPSDDDLQSLHPGTLVTQVNAQEFLNLINFFMGFYSSKVNYKTITMTTQQNGINFVLQDSGIIGYNSSHVERLFETEVNEMGITCTVLIDSLRSFARGLTPDSVISIFMDNEHKAIVLETSNQIIYLAKPRN